MNCADPVYVKLRCNVSAGGRQPTVSRYRAPTDSCCDREEVQTEAATPQPSTPPDVSVAPQVELSPVLTVRHDLLQGKQSEFVSVGGRCQEQGESQTVRDEAAYLCCDLMLILISVHQGCPN